MKIISLANQKGGVAKTTSTYNLAYLKAKSGDRVLMIDIDPQASLTIVCGLMPGKTEFSISDLLIGDADPYDCGYPVASSKLDNLYIIPSDIILAETELALTGKVAREKILKKKLSAFNDQFDYIFIDCPPNLGVLVANALSASTSVIIPTQASYLSYRGLRALKRTIEEIREDYNPFLTINGFIITMYEKIIKDQQTMLEQYKKEGPILGIIKKSADAYRSVLDGIPVTMSQPNSAISKAYSEIADKI